MADIDIFGKLVSKSGGIISDASQVAYTDTNSKYGGATTVQGALDAAQSGGNTDDCIKKTPSVTGSQTEALNKAQMDAANSGITGEKVDKYEGYESGKQNALSSAQLAAANSGVTSDRVKLYNDTYDVVSDSRYGSLDIVIDTAKQLQANSGKSKWTLVTTSTDQCYGRPSQVFTLKKPIIPNVGFKESTSVYSITLLVEETANSNVFVVAPTFLKKGTITVTAHDFSWANPEESEDDSATASTESNSNTAVIDTYVGRRFIALVTKGTQTLTADEVPECQFRFKSNNILDLLGQDGLIEVAGQSGGGFTPTEAQTAAMNSGITQETLESIVEKGCMASADGTNNIIKVQVAGTSDYLYVEAKKLSAPAKPIFGTSASIATSSNTVKTTLSCATEGAIIRYVVGEGDVTATSTQYDASTGITLVTDALGDEYENGKTIAGIGAKSFKYGVSSDRVYQGFTIYRKVENPTINIKSGTNAYSTERKVTITIPTGTNVRYTTDGTTPTKTSGTPYVAGTEITLSETTTVKAIAYKEGWSRSGTASSTITVGQKPEVRWGFSNKTDWSGVDEIETTLTNVKTGVSSMKECGHFTGTPKEVSYLWIAVYDTKITVTSSPKNSLNTLDLEKSGSTIRTYYKGAYRLYRSNGRLNTELMDVWFE